MNGDLDPEFQPPHPGDPGLLASLLRDPYPHPLGNSVANSGELKCLQNQVGNNEDIKYDLSVRKNNASKKYHEASRWFTRANNQSSTLLLIRKVQNVSKWELVPAVTNWNRQVPSKKSNLHLAPTIEVME
jgi:hypothetical protein